MLRRLLRPLPKRPADGAALLSLVHGGQQASEAEPESSAAVSALAIQPAEVQALAIPAPTLGAAASAASSAPMGSLSAF